MGTSNFYYRNASKVFAIGLDYETNVIDEDGNETDEMKTVSCESYEYDEQIENVKYHLEENKGKFSYSECETKSQSDNRNFEASFIASLSTNKSFGDVNVEVEINCFSRSGYYEGACLDWELNINVDGTTEDDVEGIQSCFIDGYTYSDMNAGLLKIQGKNAQKWANKIKNEIVEVVEKSFELSSTCFVRLATFSNGETIYQKCE